MAGKFNGTGVALATPLKADLSVDYESLEKLLEHVLAGGVDYLVVLGTTGESPVFSWKEKLEILEFILEKNNRRVPVVFGLGGNNTSDLIDKSRSLSTFGIDGILSVSPYYSKPTQQGIIRHYKLLADAFPKPIILYNVPARTSSNMTSDTTLELSTHENIIAMKEASRDLDQCQRIAENKPEDFLLISGDDQLTREMVKMGANGVISVISNILPAPFVKMVNLALQNDALNAELADKRLERAYDLLSSEGNPVSLKAGLSVMNICRDTVRPPLFEGSEVLQEQWKTYLRELEA